MAGTLLLARQVWSGDPPAPEHDALIVHEDRVVWSGSRDDLPRRAPRRRADLGDAVVVPAFFDPHFHFCQTVLTGAWVNLWKARSNGEVISRLRRAVERTPPGAWVVGWGYAEALLGGGHRLGRAELDRVAADRPVLVHHRSLHSGVASSAALAAVGFGKATPRWPGGELERDLRGEPNGRVWERAYGVLLEAANRAEREALGTGWRERAHAVARSLLAGGVVAVGDAGTTPHELTLLVAADLPLDVVALPIGPRGLFATPLEALDGPRSGEEMGRVRVGHLKVFADGAERACLRIPYPIATRAVRNLGRGEDGASANPLDQLRVLRPKPAPGALRTGMAHYTADGLRDVVAAAVARGFRVAIHGLGNEGIRFAVDALESAGAEDARIEHVMFPEPREMERMARLGITAVVQPEHLSDYGELVRTAGLEEHLPPVPLVGLTRAGVTVALSSDAPTAAWEPLLTMPVAVTRRTRDGHAIAPGEALTPSQALRAQTLVAARTLGFDDRGAIAPGFRADLAVLSGDPFEPGTTVRQTWVDGAVVHDAGR